MLEAGARKIVPNFLPMKFIEVKTFSQASQIARNKHSNEELKSLKFELCGFTIE